ncbi:unnamed protein product, partial [marine sediment metagenome]
GLNSPFGSTAGTWQELNHTLTAAEVPPHRHQEVTERWYGALTNAYASDNALWGADYPSVFDNYSHELDFTDSTTRIYTDYEGSSGAHNHGGDTWRPKAMVSTIQRLDV